MDVSHFYSLLKSSFPHQTTEGQDLALQQLSKYILSKENNEIFLLKGYAGTGKTTLVGTLVTNLWKLKWSSVLLAPAGRAAKVVSASKNWIFSQFSDYLVFCRFLPLLTRF